jgi:hypothetical protein
LCLGVAKEYNPPIRVVVLNNKHYLSMETNLIRYFPGGGGEKHRRPLRRRDRPRPDYQYLLAPGGYAYRVSHREIKPAIEPTLKREAERKLTVVDVLLGDFNPRNRYLIKRCVEQTMTFPERHSLCKRWRQLRQPKLHLIVMIALAIVTFQLLVKKVASLNTYGMALGCSAAV